MENESKTQPEKNVITDLVDFIYLINHRSVVFLTAACRLPTMVIVMLFFFVNHSRPSPVSDDFALHSIRNAPL